MPKTGIRSYHTKTKGLRWLAYYHRDGKQVLRRGFRTARQAEQWRAQSLTSVESPADSNVTVAEWVTEWLGRHRGRIRQSTYERYDGAFRNWIVPHLGPLQLRSLTFRHIEEMHDAASQAGRSAQTVRRNHSPLRTALQDAVRDGMIPHNPAVLVRLPPIQPAKTDPFTAAEALEFLEGNRDHRLYPVYHLALYSGLRQSEILGLRVGRDIDLIARTVTVREIRRHGVTGLPKSRHSSRQVALAPVTVNVLSDAISDRLSGELAFPLSQDLVSHSVPSACARAGVKRLRFHDLRHTHATLLIAAGDNIRAVSARLGHSSVAFTLQVYGHVLPGMDEELAESSASILNRDSIKNLSRTPQNGVGEKARNVVPLVPKVGFEPTRDLTPNGF